MVNRTFDELVRDLRQRREVADPPPVLLLGAGASVESGIGAMTDLFQFVNVATFDEFCAYINPLTADERYRLLARFLQSRKPADVTPGYRALAALCAEAYFDLILTTNLDPLFDDALAAAQLWRKDYLLIVNGVIRPERLDLLLKGQSPRVKVVKLHGDLFHRFMAWTPAEMDAFINDVAARVTPALQGRDFLVVGHSLRDARLRQLVLGAGGAIWYTNPNAAPDFLADNDRVRAVVSADATFERLFTRLAQALDVTAPTKALPARPAQRAALTVGREGAQTLDDLMASVVAVVGPGGYLAMTGFVLADPRVIVIDGYVGNTSFIQDKATLATTDGRRLEARVLKRITSHPFGPWVLEAPAELKVTGLSVNTQPLEANLPVRIGVAAGERIGISAGVIEKPRERKLDITPIGAVSYLVAVNAVTAPGSSGAPVVDAAFAVRGFVVAGATDQPPSYMYPAARWFDSLPSA